MPSFLRSFLFANFTQPQVLDSDEPTPVSTSVVGALSTSNVVAEMTPAAASISPSGNSVDNLPLCLRCPKCQLATANWSRFHSHLDTCVNSGAISYTLYWCPSCSTVSTEKGLIEEHALIEHDTQVSFSLVISFIFRSGYRC